MIMTQHRYGEHPLSCDDIKYIYTLAFATYHMVDSVYFRLKNAYASAAFMEGHPFDRNGIPEHLKLRHESFLPDYQLSREEDLILANACKDTYKTFSQIWQEVIIPFQAQQYIEIHNWLEFEFEFEGEDIKPYNTAQPLEKGRQGTIKEKAYFSTHVMHLCGIRWVRQEKLLMLRNEFLNSEFFVPCPDGSYQLCHRGKQARESYFDMDPDEYGYLKALYVKGVQNPIQELITRPVYDLLSSYLKRESSPSALIYLMELLRPKPTPHQTQRAYQRTLQSIHRHAKIQAGQSVFKDMLKGTIMSYHPSVNLNKPSMGVENNPVKFLLIDQINRRLPEYIEDSRPPFGMAKAGAHYAHNTVIKKAGLNFHKLIHIGFPELTDFYQEQKVWSRQQMTMPVTGSSVQKLLEEE